MLCSRLFLLMASAPLLPAEQPTLLDRAYRQMYNLDFNGAHKTIAEYAKVAPDDPLAPASDAAAYLFTEFDRLHILQGEFFTHDENFRTQQQLTPNPQTVAAFQSQITHAESLAEKALRKNEKDTNALFAKALALGLKSDYEGLVEKKYMSSLSNTKAGRLTAEKLLSIDPNYHDAWLAIGVENYMLSLKPMAVRWLLRLAGNQTDRVASVEKLKITAEKGRYLRPFARLLIAVAALREHDIPRAKQLLKELRDEFPGNHLYASELARLN